MEGRGKGRVREGKRRKGRKVNREEEEKGGKRVRGGRTEKGKLEKGVKGNREEEKMR